MTSKLLFADDFLDILQFTRTVYISARPGGGKTHLAVTLAAWLLGSGLVERVVGNVPCVFSSAIELPFENCAIILDESWLYLMGRNDVFLYAGFVRKHNHYLLLPSVYPVHRLLMRFHCWRWYNMFTMGVHGWIYKWALDRETEHEKGYFVLMNPEDGFGYYDSLVIPVDDGGVVDAIEGTSGNIWKKRSTRGSDEKQDIQDLEAVLSDSSESLEGVADEVRSSIKQIVKRSKRR
jgi:hypothetical protein